MCISCMGCGDAIDHTSVEPRRKDNPEETQFHMILGPLDGYETRGFATNREGRWTYHCWRCFPQFKPWGEPSQEPSVAR